VRIKRIELSGFKSFVQSTVLEFPLGVTAIVGPNGCGKSNVVDAIRWVLGEQSPKHLRGDAMEDVIFAGNGDNGPLGMAEVSLMLEREEEDFVRAAAERTTEEGAEPDGALPPEIGQASEVMVTRRYFRSGESEFYINRAPCRLKDITELFLGTGVGTKAYAIIEQGRIEQLVNAKPEELRFFIEEAAGVTRFRNRRLAAERKVERTRENLVRVQDVLRELERQKGSLERQARRAEEYHRLKEELRHLDLRVLAARRRRLCGEEGGYRERLVTLERDTAALQSELHRLSSTTDEVRSRRRANEERLRTVEAELAEQRLTAGEAQARGAALSERRGELATRAARAGEEVVGLSVRRDALTEVHARLEREGASLQSEEATAGAERASSERCLEELAAAATSLERHAEEAKDALLDALAEEVRSRNLADAVRQRREELVDRRQRLDEEQRLLGERLQANALATDGARARLAAIADMVADASARRAALVAEQTDLVAQDVAGAVALEAARSSLTHVASRMESLRELQVRHEGCTRGVASVLEREPNRAVLLARVLRVPAELERAVAAALGTRLGHVVVSDGRTALEAVQWLRETNGGRVTAIPRESERRPTVIVPPGRRLLDEIEVDAEHWALAESLLGQVLLAVDLEHALTQWQTASHTVTVVTVDGEVIDPTGAVAGGSEAPLEETLLARERELRDLAAEHCGVQREVDAAAAALSVLRDRAAVLGQVLRDLDERVRMAGMEQLSIEKDRERLDEERARIAGELEAAALEASGLAGADGEAAQELAMLDQRRAQAEHTAAARRAELVERQGAISAWREEHAEAERRRTAAAVREAAVGERRRGVATEEGRVRATLDELRLRIEENAAEAAATEEGARLAAIGASAAEEAARIAQESVSVLAGERSDLEQAIAQAQASLTADDIAERTAREGLEVLRDERGHVEVALAERRLALEHLAAQLVERYDLAISALDGVPAEAEEPGEVEAARAEALRGRLVHLCDVNPGAVQELEDVRARHEFLLAQRKDLEASIDDLHRTIVRLSRTSRQRFEATFGAANGKLAEVFPKLFPDGRARLELVAVEDSDEPGIEIVVQPAGKKLQSLSLLSGGEKALTATALVLSLFLIRPTPFCLLDEVDAPLDEANIGRFNQIVREMAEATQFVLITHNRRTMEAADTLYGITMEQPGVSKVVSVRLREAA